MVTDSTVGTACATTLPSPYTSISDSTDPSTNRSRAGASGAVVVAVDPPTQIGMPERPAPGLMPVPGDDRAGCRSRRPPTRAGRGHGTRTSPCTASAVGSGGWWINNTVPAVAQAASTSLSHAACSSEKNPSPLPGAGGVDEDQAQAIEVEHTIDRAPSPSWLVHQLGAHGSSIVVVPRHVHDGYAEACRHWIERRAAARRYASGSPSLARSPESSITSKRRRPSATIRATARAGPACPPARTAAHRT